MTRLQSRTDGVQVGFSFCRVAFSIIGQVDRARHLDSYTDVCVVDCWLGAVLFEREEFIFDMPCIAWHAPRRFHSRGKGPVAFYSGSVLTLSQIVLYLSYFYKHHELSLRLGFFWTAAALADVIGGFLAFGLLHLRGVDGQAGWRWLFLIEVCPLQCHI